jgi:hypothetical protein
MRRIVLSLCCSTVIALAATARLSAQESPVSAPPATKSLEESPVSVPPAVKSLDCTKEELMTFFPKPIVQDVLIREKFTPEQAERMSQELSKKDQELVKIVEEKASKLNPNPFKDLNQRDLAIKIYRETLFEVFAKVLKANGVTDDERIQQILDTIQQSKSKLFIECIRKQQINVPDPILKSE